MAVLIRNNFFGPLISSDPAQPGVTGYDDIGAATSGYVKGSGVDNFRRTTRALTQGSTRTMNLLQSADTVLGNPEGPKWVYKPDTWPSPITGALTGPWSLRMYFSRNTDTGFGSYIVQRLLTFRLNGSNVMRLEFDNQATGWRVYMRDSATGGTIPAVNTSASRNGLYRIEIQCDPDRSTDVVWRVYREDLTTPVVMSGTISAAAGGTSWDELIVGSKDTAENWYRSTQWGALEVHNDYSLGNQFTSNPVSPTPATTTATGAASFNPAFAGRFNTSSGTDPKTVQARVLTEGVDYTAYLDVDYTTAGTFNRKLDLYVPTGTPPEGGWPTIVWAHSGFFSIGSRKDLPTPWRDDMLNAGYAVASVEYVLSSNILAPLSYPAYGAYDSGYRGARYPSHVVDFKRAAAYLRDNGYNTYGLNPEKFVASGWSAGGYIALSAVLTCDLAEDDATPTPNKMSLLAASTAGHAWGDGYTGPDPTFLGALIINGPVSMDHACEWDPTYPDSGAILNLTMYGYLGQAATVGTRAPAAPWTSMHNQFALPGARTMPVLYIRGTSDYLVHWEHADLLEQGLTALDMADLLTLVDEPTVHTLDTYDRDIQIAWLDDLTTTAVSQTVPISFPVGVTVNTPTPEKVGDNVTVPTSTVEVTVASATAADEGFEVITNPPELKLVYVDAVEMPFVLGTHQGLAQKAPPVTGLSAVGGAGQIHTPIIVYGDPNYRPVKPTLWDFYGLLPREGGYIAALTHATSRSVEFKLSEPSTIRFSYDAKDPSCHLLHELSVDVMAERNNIPLVRGRIVGSSDTIGPTEHKVEFSVADYRSMLDRRIIYDRLVPANPASGTEQSLLVWLLIEATQGKVGGDLGITRGVSNRLDGLTVYRYDEIPEGAVVGRTIDEISKRQYGFDWEIDPMLRLQYHQPHLGREGLMTFIYGGNVTSISRASSPSNFANAVRVEPGENSGLNPVELTVSDLGTRSEGRFDVGVTSSNTDLMSQDDVTAMALGVLGTNGILTPSYTLQLAPGVWDPDNCWLGDTVQLIVNSGRLNIDALYRVQSIKVDIKDDGTEAVSVVVGMPLRTASERLYEVTKQVEELRRK